MTHPQSPPSFSVPSVSSVVNLHLCESQRTLRLRVGFFFPLLILLRVNSL
jgi:hypothetical protein